MKPQSGNQDKTANLLINENSPYLLQHAYNPVNWMPWGSEATEKAKKDNKLMIISVGYSACHWCHVMEHESFEDSTVAAAMNENFVSIKVDREERPDVDDVYMTACQLVSRQGCGWPLNAFALPDGRPVWAGTYFPKDQWMNVLNQFAKLWEEDPKKLYEYADQLTKGIQQQDMIQIGEPGILTADAAYQMALQMINGIDPENGGRKGAPKFPMPVNYEYLMAFNTYSDHKKGTQALTTTIDNMAAGGIYDHLEGGFARYSVDALWIVPHFEKMLYDNGQLLALYANAYKRHGIDRYKEIVEETIDFLKANLLEKNGGFFSSLDADSDGEEGAYYVWEKEELGGLLTEQELIVIEQFYNIKEEGNWEHGKNILWHPGSRETSAQKLGLSLQEFEAIRKRAMSKMLDARNHRNKPGLDDKVLCSWNALMLYGLIEASLALDRSDYLDLAIQNAEFIKQFFIESDGRLWRNYKDESVKINGFLDDYALLGRAMIRLYEVTFNEEWLYQAKQIIDYAIDHFYNESSKMFNYTSDIDPPLVARKMELSDNVIPASNSIIARVLHRLGLLLDEGTYSDIAKQQLYNMIPVLTETGQTAFYANWAHLYLEMLQPTYEIAILGPEAVDMSRKMQSRYLPNAIFLGGTTEGTLQLLEQKLVPNETTIYVCQNKVCQLPVQQISEAMKQLTYDLE